MPPSQPSDTPRALGPMPIIPQLAYSVRSVDSKYTLSPDTFIHPPTRPAHPPARAVLGSSDKRPLSPTPLIRPTAQQTIGNPRSNRLRRALYLGNRMAMISDHHTTHRPLAKG